MPENRLKIGITQGDPNGIGWETILRIFADSRMSDMCAPVIYGSPEVASYYKSKFSETSDLRINMVASGAEARKGRLSMVACAESFKKVEPGQISSEAGAAAVAALRKAVQELKSGAIDALVTAPISKESVQSDDFNFTGHTEFLASELEGDSMMIMCSERLRVGLVTKHIPVSQISESISAEKIVKDLKNLRETLKKDFGVVEPRIAVLSLNPHAGDGGLLGREEQDIIKPAIVEAYTSGVLAFGPFAADGLFASGEYANYDGILAMYHDQGLTPFKTLSPEGVNFTAGLSHVRTSPDHGTAFGIAGQGVADLQSMRNAIYMAIDTLKRRRAWLEWSKRPLQKAEREHGGRDLSVKDIPNMEKVD